MKKISLNLTVFLFIFSISCNRKPSPEYLNGVWELRWVDHDNRNILLIENDSISIPNYYTIQTKLSVPFEITGDSLNIPNPCVKERYSYQLINDTFYVDSTYMIYKPKKITSELLFYNSPLDITLEDKKPSFRGEKINFEHYSILIGKEKDSTSFPKIFPNNFCLIINGNFCDSSNFETWLNLSKEDSDEILNIVIYKDQKFNSDEYSKFLNTINTHFGKKAIAYEAFFDKNSKYYLGIKKINLNYNSPNMKDDDEYSFFEYSTDNKEKPNLYAVLKSSLIINPPKSSYHSSVFIELLTNKEGFPVGNDADAFDEIEEKLILNLSADHSVYLGHITTYGKREVVFYTKSPRLLKNKFNSLKTEINVAFSIEIREDKNWSDISLFLQ